MTGFIRELDGLRGVAILAVTAHHFWPLAGTLAPAADLAHAGWVGVDLFFVISGFLITGILVDTRDDPHYYRNFLARRILRVFPLYYAVIAAAFLAIPEVAAESGSPVWYLAYAGNAREAWTGAPPAYVLAPTWSLAIEEQFYLAMPLVVALASRRALTRVLVAVVVLAPVFRVATALAWPDNWRMQYVATPGRADALALGCLLAVYVRSGRWHPNPRHLASAATALVGACAIAFALGGLDRTTWLGRTAGYSLVAATAAAIVLWAVTARDTRATAALRWRPLCYLGMVSYGAYLLQRPVEVALHAALLDAGVQIHLAGAWLLAVKLAATVAAATVSWYALERPLLRLKRRFGGTPRGAARAA